MSATEKKISSDLLFGRNPGQSQSMSRSRAADPVLVDISATSINAVEQRIAAVGGKVVASFARDGMIRAAIPPADVTRVADLAEVNWIRTADVARTNGLRFDRHRAAPLLRGLMSRLGASFAGALTSQGFVTHTSNLATALGFTGAGVRVGVLSDSASPGRIAALIASGDLPPNTVVVPGQVGGGNDEGTAMMEIIHDLAPGARLFFATANGGQAAFANNIRVLRFIYGCDIIVDDIIYLAEGSFQDDIVARAVNDVTADGALYFSSAGNGGNVTWGSASIWEGDFRNGGPVSGPILEIEKRGFFHNFGTTQNPQLYNVLTSPLPFALTLKWADPLGASTNDYDIFITDSTGTVVKGGSAASQTGRQDPLEFVIVGTGCGTASAVGYCPAAGDRIYVVLWSGEPRALRLDTNQGSMALVTPGATYGHNAGVNTVSVAATYWNSARTGTRPFTGAANLTEWFSSDGPRRLFFFPNGTPITPGNFLFSTNGGVSLLKPDLTAADGVFTKTPGFLPFFGTSAASPHAAAIAALVKSARPALSNIQIRRVLSSTALDSMAPGPDRDAGFGIVMALRAIEAALSVP